MPAFLHYFNQGLLASTDQVEQRIQSYLSPFDDQLLSNVFDRIYRARMGGPPVRYEPSEEGGFVT